MSDATNMLWLDALLAPSYAVRETPERERARERAEALSDARARHIATFAVTVSKPEQAEYETWLRLLGDAWTGKLCTDPHMNGQRYMAIVARWTDRTPWGASAFSNGSK